jgi:hypothetical protein
LCEYTSHGHCGYLEVGDLTGRVLNDPTLELLKKTAVSQAKAGADIIAPSGMMDGFVQAIRSGLDEAGYEDTPICRMLLSMLRLTMGLSVMQRNLLPNLAIAAPTKWTRAMLVKP